MPDEPLLLTSPKLEIQAAADRAKPATISALAYSGGVMTIGGTRYVISLSGLTTPTTVPLLVDHENQIGAVAGSVRPTKRDGRLDVEGNLARGTAAGDQVIALSVAGVELAVSVGVEPEEKEYISPGQTVEANGQTFVADGDGLVFVSKSNLKEISIVPIGADHLAVASIAASANRKGGQAMPTTPTFDQYLTANGHDPATVTTDMRLALQATYDATHGTGRVDADRIMTIAGSFPPDVISSDRGRALQAAAGRGTINASGFQAGLVQIDRDFARADLLVAERPVGPTIHSSSQDTGSQPSVLQAAFCQAAGLPNREKHFDEPTLEASDRQYPGGLGLSEMLLQCAHEGGYDGRGVIRGSNLGQVLHAAFSTHTATTLLSTTGNKFLRDGFNTVEQVWRAISRRRPVKDFKEITSFRLTASLEYEEVGPVGLIKHGTLGQESYSNQAKTYAKMFSLTRQDIINDDLGAFDDLRNRLGRGGALKLNSVFWASFLDSATFFTTPQGNLIEGAASALAADGVALASAEKAFLDLRSSGGPDTSAPTHPLGIAPALLLMPTSLGVTGRKLYSSQEIRDTTADTVYATENLFHDRFKPLVSAYLGAANDNGSDTGWYLCADPANLPLIEVCFLDGMETPTIESSEADFNTLGIQSRGYWDFGVTKAEWRAGVMSDGTD